MSTTATNLARTRISSLLDANSFVEIGGLITARNTDFNLAQADTSADGVITGYGVIDGNLVYVYSQDSTVLGGTIGEMHAKKITKLYDLAMKMGAPIIGLLDCAGLRLQEATDALHGFGEIYIKQTMASGVIPQITAILGTSGGGLAIMSALTDFTFMEESKGKLFVNSPNALAGNEISKCNTTSAQFQSEETGLVDGIGDESSIIQQIRQLVCMLPSSNEDNMSYEECRDDLNRVCSDLAIAAKDPSIALANISDNSIFFETKSNYAKDMVTGFIKLNGITVGAVANRTEIYDEEGNVAETFEPVLSVKGAKKAAAFVEFCDAFDLPILTLTNVKGFQACVHSEKHIASAVSKLTYAFANATVPKVNIITEYAYGSAYLAMNSKSIGADIVYAWPNAQIGMMDAKSAARIMYPDAGADVISEKATEYASLQSSAVAAAKRGYVDTIIEADDTRKYVIGAFEMLFTKKEERPGKKHGTV